MIDDDSNLDITGIKRVDLCVGVEGPRNNGVHREEIYPCIRRAQASKDEPPEVTE